MHPTTILLHLPPLYLWIGSAFAYNCLVARQHSVQDGAQLAAWRGCLSRWQGPDRTEAGASIAPGALKECGNRTWFSNLHSWHSLPDCLRTCSPCLGQAIELAADAVTCYERSAAAPSLARCMLGYNPKPRADMRLTVCNDPDSSRDACHVNPFIPNGHYHDLARPGQENPALGEVIDIGCTLDYGLCMNWPLNGMTPQYVPLGEKETPGD